MVEVVAVVVVVVVAAVVAAAAAAAVAVVAAVAVALAMVVGASHIALNAPQRWSQHARRSSGSSVRKMAMAVKTETTVTTIETISEPTMQAAPGSRRK